MMRGVIECAWYMVSQNVCIVSLVESTMHHCKASQKVLHRRVEGTRQGIMYVRYRKMHDTADGRCKASCKASRNTSGSPVAWQGIRVPSKIIFVGSSLTECILVGIFSCIQID